jgi:replication-associated recombination protein RarA
MIRRSAMVVVILSFILGSQALAVLKVFDNVYGMDGAVHKVTSIDRSARVPIFQLDGGSQKVPPSAWYEYQLRNLDGTPLANVVTPQFAAFKIGGQVLLPNGEITTIKSFDRQDPRKTTVANGSVWEVVQLRVASEFKADGTAASNQAPAVEKSRYKIGEVVNYEDQPMTVREFQIIEGEIHLKIGIEGSKAFYVVHESEVRPYLKLGSNIPKAPDAAKIGQEPVSAAPREIPEVHVKDAEDKDALAWDIIKTFSRDLVETSVKDGFVYTQDPDLRIVEDNILRGLSKVENGSVKLLAPAGVGKTVLIQRLMARIAKGDVPEGLKKYHFMGFSAASIQAGAKYVGAFESRVNAMIEQSRAMPIVWIVDEIHSLSGAGAHSENSNDLFQTLKPEMPSGKIKIIGMSTPDEWAGAFDADSALNRRFARVDITEPSGEKLLRILGDWIKKYGKQKLSRQILQEVVRMSDEFAIDGAQPSRATAMLAEIYAEKDINPGKVGLADLKLAAKRLWNVDASELDPKIRYERYATLEKSLQDLSGQEPAKLKVLETAQAVMTGMQDHGKPRYRVMFAGPKGQGKTEIVKIFAKSMGLPEDNRILMSNFTSPHQLEEMKNQIRTYVLRNQFTVLFFDEIEKAHPSVQKALLGILDAGMMTYEIKEGQKTVQKTMRLKNTSVFMATNAGQNYISGLKSPKDFDEKKFREAMIQDDLDEFMLDRMEALIPFYYLSKQEFGGVLKIHIEKTLQEILTNTRVKVDIQNKDAMLKDLTEKYFQPQMSNREASRIVAEYIRKTVTAALFQIKSAKSNLQMSWNGQNLVKGSATPVSCKAYFGK